MFLTFALDPTVAQGLVDTLLELIYKEKKSAKKMLNKEPSQFQQVVFSKNMCDRKIPDLPWYVHLHGGKVGEL